MEQTESENNNKKFRLTDENIENSKMNRSKNVEESTPIETFGTLKTPQKREKLFSKFLLKTPSPNLKPTKVSENEI